MPAQDEQYLLLLDDGRPGHWRQVSALAKAIGLPARRLPFVLRWPYRLAAPRRLPFWHRFHAALIGCLSAEAPRMVLGCGRRSALVSLALKGHWDTGPAHVQLLDCGLLPGRFDRVVAPRHDGLEGANVIPVTGSLNPVDRSLLDAAKSLNSAKEGRAATRVCIVLGGPTRRCRISIAQIVEELSVLESLAEPPHTVIVTTPAHPAVRRQTWRAGCPVSRSRQA